jgi:hypothetical protein
MVTPTGGISNELRSTNRRTTARIIGTSASSRTGERPMQDGPVARALSGRDQRSATGCVAKDIAVFDEEEQRYTAMSLFPDDRKVPADALHSVQVNLSGLELRRPRTYGNCWLACELWHQLGLDESWQKRLCATDANRVGPPVVEE